MQNFDDSTWEKSLSTSDDKGYFLFSSSKSTKNESTQSSSKTKNELEYIQFLNY